MKSKKHILVVDDEAPIRFAVSRILSKAGYFVSEAVDGEQARKSLFSSGGKAPEIDLVLMDIQLPQIDGRQLFKELVAINACPPVILMTGSSGLEHEGIELDPLCLGILSKPFGSEQLRATVSNAFAVLSGHAPREKVVMPDVAAEV